jgi:hypothetical protein
MIPENNPGPDCLNKYLCESTDEYNYLPPLLALFEPEDWNYPQAGLG